MPGFGNKHILQYVFMILNRANCMTLVMLGFTNVGVDSVQMHQRFYFSVAAFDISNYCIC